MNKVSPLELKFYKILYLFFIKFVGPKGHISEELVACQMLRIPRAFYFFLYKLYQNRCSRFSVKQKLILMECFGQNRG